jgi:hypothetical protein
LFSGPGRHFARAEIISFVALVLVQWEIKHEDDGGSGSGGKVELSMGKNGVPRLEQARAGLGSLPPLKEDKVQVQWRRRLSK